jgi:GNAT superfamily N-acetyltransferase
MTPPKRSDSSRVRVEELGPAKWPDFERLFGSNGACGGCWCMFWRVEKGERFDALKGEPARRRMKKLIESGAALGALAYVGDEPVGWLSYGPRRDYPKLDRAPSLACDDADQVWSAPCFFVKAKFRGQGVASALLEHATRALKGRGAKILEGYPSKVAGKSAAAFIWTGTTGLFERAGFEYAEKRPRGKQRMRKRLR